MLGGLEAIEAIVRAGIETRRPLELAVWTNEEGSRFAPGCMGSRTFAEPSVLDRMLAARDLDGVTVAEALASVRTALAGRVAPRRLGGPVAAYVEAHIEQGPELEAAGRAIGLVTGIQGRRRILVEVTRRGRPRRDAGAAPAQGRAVGGRRHDPARSRPDARSGGHGALHGRAVVVSPNAPSVVPGHVLFTIDLRHPDRRA